DGAARRLGDLPRDRLWDRRLFKGADGDRNGERGREGEGEKGPGTPGLGGIPPGDEAPERDPKGDAGGRVRDETELAPRRDQGLHGEKENSHECRDRGDRNQPPAYERPPKHG